MIKKLLDAWGNTDNTIKTLNKVVDDYYSIQSNLHKIEMWLNKNNVFASTDKVNGHIESNMQTNIQTCIGLAEQFNGRIKWVLLIKSTFDKAVLGLDFAMQEIVIRRHCKRLNWRSITYNLPFKTSERHTQRLYLKALEELYTKIGANEVKLLYKQVCENSGCTC